MIVAAVDYHQSIDCNIGLSRPRISGYSILKIGCGVIFLSVFFRSIDSLHMKPMNGRMVQIDHLKFSLRPHLNGDKQ